LRLMEVAIAGLRAPGGGGSVAVSSLAGDRVAGSGAAGGGGSTASALPRFRTIAGPAVAIATAFRFLGGCLGR
jgi:hypothetical protein